MHAFQGRIQDLKKRVEVQFSVWRKIRGAHLATPLPLFLWGQYILSTELTPVIAPANVSYARCGALYMASVY